MEPVPRGNYSSGVNIPEERENRICSVADVCALLGITRKTLFFYDRENLLKPLMRQGPQKAKQYGPQEIERLKTILEYRKAGLLLKEIRILLDEEDCDRKTIFEAALFRAEKEIREKEEEILRLRGWIASLPE